MANILRKIDYFYIMISNTPGQAARIMSQLAGAQVNLLAFSGFPEGRRAQLDLVPENSAQLIAAAKKTKLKLSKKKTGFLLHADDRVGAMIDILNKLAAAKINVTAIDAVTSGEGRFGAIFWVKPPQVAKAAKLLNAI